MEHGQANLAQEVGVALSQISSPEQVHGSTSGVDQLPLSSLILGSRPPATTAALVRTRPPWWRPWWRRRRQRRPGSSLLKMPREHSTATVLTRRRPSCCFSVPFEESNAFGQIAQSMAGTPRWSPPDSAPNWPPRNPFGPLCSQGGRRRPTADSGGSGGGGGGKYSLLVI